VESSSGSLMKGLVFNIQRFSVHDGPGIRTTVFMKGCPLRCPWCSNPESQSFARSLMARDVNCRGCGKCIESCPQTAIRLTSGGYRKIDWEKCDQCLNCVQACDYHSLQICGQYLGDQEVLDEVGRDVDFYRNSGGGITISGGEPLYQAEFVEALLKGCREKGIHTAVDTTGHASWEKFEIVLPYVDLLLFDLKHLDPGEHERTTGVRNHIILRNLVEVSRTHAVWLRIPLIAGFNDSEKHIADIADFGNELGVGKISLLPYHEGGKSKSRQIGKDWRFVGEAPGDEHVEHLKKVIRNRGIEVSAGN
jgi:pyruvate formate lyase activating enzyme